MPTEFLGELSLYIIIEEYIVCKNEQYEQSAEHLNNEYSSYLSCFPLYPGIVFQYKTTVTISEHGKCG